MIEQQTLQVCQSHMHRAAGDKKLSVYAGAPLSEIVATLTVDGLGEDFSTQDVLDYVNSVEEHAVCMTQVKELGVRAVRQLSSLVRNTINPHIRKIVEQVSEGPEVRDDGFGYRVTTFKLSALVSNPLVMELVQKHRSVPVTGTTAGNGVGKFEKEYIFSMLQMGGDTEFNEYAEHWYNEDETAVDKIKAALAGESELSNIPDPDLHAAILIILAGTKVPPPNTASNLAVWELNRNRLMAYAAQSVHKVLDSYRMAESSQRLYVSSFQSGVRDIIVYDRVYKDMLTKGLTVEALMGNEMLNRKFMSHQILDANAIKICEAKYRQERTAHETAKQKLTMIGRNRWLYRVLRDDLEEIANKESWPVDGDNREKAGERLKSVCARILENERLRDEPIEDIVAAILLATWYAHTDAARLIDIASRICRDDPELDAEEAFTMAKLEYVGLWIASQIRPVDSKE